MALASNSRDPHHTAAQPSARHHNIVANHVEINQRAHIEDIEEAGDTSDLTSLFRAKFHSEAGYDTSATEIAGTTLTQSNFSPNRFGAPKMTASSPRPQRSGVSPSSSPRLPSPPPFTEVQIGPKSPTIGEGPESQLGEANKQDDGSTRRIRPGTKAADMASGPPLIPLAEVRMLRPFKSASN
jgi:hypothetical protein